MSRPEDESEKARAWKLLSEARLIDIDPNEVPERIKEAKSVVMGRLSELLNARNELHERESAAYSLATLKKLEKMLEKALAQGAKERGPGSV